MYARSATVGILAVIAFTLPELAAPGFTLQSTGAVRLHASGHDARYGVVPAAVQGRPILVLSLGATRAPGAVQLTRSGDRMPAPGRYPIRSSWEEIATDTNSFHASFMAGTVERPLGWFHGESGSVTITKAQEGRISGTFEVWADGFMAGDSADSDRWVEVRGSFDAEGDSTVSTIASAR
jgi:hypothetical protein